MKPRDEIEREFKQAVNMSASELDRWLETKESKSVGWHTDGDEDGESVGHKSGRAIVELKTVDFSSLNGNDLKQMSRVVSYVRRHLAQRPEGDVTETRWRYSLMNWGHDPLKDQD